MTEANSGISMPGVRPSNPPDGKLIPSLDLILLANAKEIMMQAVCLLAVVADQIAPELDDKELPHLSAALRGADRSLEAAMDNLVVTCRRIVPETADDAKGVTL